MSGRHKALMHVIFLFSAAISPAFPHRSLLFPNPFKKGIYFCLKPHALSPLIQGLRFHWDSKHTSSLNKLDIPFSPAGAACSQTRCGLEWAPPGFPSGRIEGLEEKFLIDYSQEQIPGCTCSAQHWVTHPVSLDPALGWGVPMQSWLCLFPQLSAHHWRFPPAENTESHNKPV